MNRLLSFLRREFFLFFLSALLPVGIAAAQETDELYLKPPGTHFNGSQVVQLQRFLLLNGFDLGPDGVDGWFGPATESALKAWQSAGELAETGRIAVKDIPVKLNWTPVLKYSEPERVPLLYTGELTSLTEDGCYNTGYGPFVIDTDWDPVMRYSGFVLSPNKRFCFATYYSPDIELQMGQPLVLIDTLTETEFHISPLDCVVSPGTPEYTGLYEKTYVSVFDDIQWTEGNNLFLRISLHFTDGTEMRTTRLLDCSGTGLKINSNE